MPEAGEGAAPTPPPLTPRGGARCTNTPDPCPRSPSWDDLGEGDCDAFGLKDWRLSEGKLPWWVASRLAAPSSGEPLVHLETGGLCSKPEEDLGGPGELAAQSYSSFRLNCTIAPPTGSKGAEMVKRGILTLLLWPLRVER